LYITQQNTATDQQLAYYKLMITMYHRQKCNILTTTTTHKGLTGNPNSWTEHSNKKPRNRYSSHWHVTL